MPGVKITGYGSYLPARVVTNEELSATLEQRLKALMSIGRINPAQHPLASLTTSPEWILERTGIQTRHYAASDQNTSDLATQAIKQGYEMSGLVPNDGGFMLLATVTENFITTPSTPPIIQHAIGWQVERPNPELRDAPLLINRFTNQSTAACSGFLSVLLEGVALIKSGLYKNGYVVGADIMSRRFNPLLRDIAIILGDGAFAISLEATDNPAEDCFPLGNKGWFFGCDGSMADHIVFKAGGTACPVTAEMLADPLCADLSINMKGRKVFKELVMRCKDQLILQALERAGLKLEDIGLFVFHQANLRMIDAITDKDGLNIQDRTVNNVQEVGNTTCASVGLALCEAIRRGKLQPGMKVMLTVMGGGLTWGTCILTWPEIEDNRLS